MAVEAAKSSMTRVQWIGPHEQPNTPSVRGELGGELLDLRLARRTGLTPGMPQFRSETKDVDVSSM